MNFPFVAPKDMTNSEVVDALIELTYEHGNDHAIASELKTHEIDIHQDRDLLEAAFQDISINRRLVLLLQENHLTDFSDEIACNAFGE